MSQQVTDLPAKTDDEEAEVKIKFNTYQVGAGMILGFLIMMVVPMIVLFANLNHYMGLPPGAVLVDAAFMPAVVMLFLTVALLIAKGFWDTRSKPEE